MLGEARGKLESPPDPTPSGLELDGGPPSGLRGLFSRTGQDWRAHVCDQHSGVLDIEVSARNAHHVVSVTSHFLCFVFVATHSLWEVHTFVSHGGGRCKSQTGHGWRRRARRSYSRCLTSETLIVSTILTEARRWGRRAANHTQTNVKINAFPAPAKPDTRLDVEQWGVRCDARRIRGSATGHGAMLHSTNGGITNAVNNSTRTHVPTSSNNSGCAG